MSASGLAAPRLTGSFAWPRFLARRRPALVGTAAVTLFLVVWQLAGSSSAYTASLISSPTEIFAAGLPLAASGELASDAAVSLQELALGFIPAVAVGVVVGLAMAQVRRVRYLLDPLMIALYTAPRIALIPILVVWFGTGSASKVAVVFLGAVFPVLVNTMVGAQQVDPLWVRAVRAFGGSPLQVITKVVLPGTLPPIMAGIRLGLGRALISLIIGEMYVSIAGIGWSLRTYSDAGRTPELLFLVVLTAAFGFVCVTLLRWAEERIGPWRKEIEG